jgi:hypothetical protein
VARSARRNRQRICALIVSRLIGPNRADTGCSAAWLARLLWEQEAGSSNLPTPTTSDRSGQWPCITDVSSSNRHTFRSRGGRSAGEARSRPTVLVVDDGGHRTLVAAKASRLAAMNASARAEFDEAYETEQRPLDDADGSSEVDAPD